MIMLNGCKIIFLLYLVFFKGRNKFEFLRMRFNNINIFIKTTTISADCSILFFVSENNYRVNGNIFPKNSNILPKNVNMVPVIVNVDRMNVNEALMIVTIIQKNINVVPMTGNIVLMITTIHKKSSTFHVKESTASEKKTTAGLFYSYFHAMAPVAFSSFGKYLAVLEKIY